MSPARWLKSVKTIKCKFSTSSLTECMWRRFQVNDQQAERQKKNVLQRALAFASRADEILSKDRVLNTVMIVKNNRGPSDMIKSTWGSSHGFHDQTRPYHLQQCFFGRNLALTTERRSFAPLMSTTTMVLLFSVQN